MGNATWQAYNAVLLDCSAGFAAMLADNATRLEYSAT